MMKKRKRQGSINIAGLTSKYDLYEKSVQSPDHHIEWFVTLYKDIFGKYARQLREDFCGTFALSNAWVTRNRRNKALSLDLDPAPLQYGRKKHLSELNRDQKSRLDVRQADVLIPTTPKSDLIIACNFSFNIFKERKVLLQYFSSCLKSLGSKGALILEMAGGPGMIATSREQKTVKLPSGKKFVYVWEQQSFDPITHDAKYRIHFKDSGGKMLKNAFVYDWRLWTVPEVIDLLKEAGFTRTQAYWETSFRGKGTGEFVPSSQGDNAYSWITYIAGIKE